MAQLDSREDIRKMWNRVDHKRLPCMWTSRCFGCMGTLSKYHADDLAAVKTFPKSQFQSGEINICMLCSTCYAAGNIAPPKTAKEFKTRHAKILEISEVIKKESGEEAMTVAFSAVSRFTEEAAMVLRDQFTRSFETRVAQAATYANDIREKEEEVRRKRQILKELNEESEEILELTSKAKLQLEAMKENPDLKKYQDLLAIKAQLTELKETISEQMNSIPTMLSALRFKYESEMRRITVRSLPEATTWKLGEELAKKLNDTLRAEIDEAVAYMKTQIPTNIDSSLCNSSDNLGETSCGMCFENFTLSQRKVLGCGHSFTCVKCWEKHTEQMPNSHDASRGITRCPQCRAPMNQAGNSVPEYRSDRPDMR